MPTTDFALMKKRRDAAISALKFFKEKKTVRSTNNPFVFLTPAEQTSFSDYRRDETRENTFAQAFEDAARTGVGNCDEKARICYASLIGNPRIAGGQVTHAESVDYDHIYVLVTDAAVPPGGANLNTLGTTAMVVDGWTEDWYFPNLSWVTACKNGLTHGVPNPRQLYVRVQIAAHLLRAYTDSKGNTLLLPAVPSGDLHVV